jgi:hypothetical protein
LEDVNERHTAEINAKTEKYNKLLDEKSQQISEISKLEGELRRLKILYSSKEKAIESLNQNYEDMKISRND